MKSPKAPLLIAAAGLLAAVSLHATTFYWDGNATTANGVSDNTDTTTRGWLSDGNWDDGSVSTSLASWTSGDSAVFGGSAASETVTLASSITLGDLTFGSGAAGSGTSGTHYTISGGTLSLGSASTLTTNTATTFSTVLAGTAGFTKTGAGTLTLATASTVTGAVNVNAGTLLLNNNYLSNATSVTISGATLTLTDSVGGSTSNTYALNGLSLQNSTLSVAIAPGAGDGASRLTQKVDFTGTNTVTRSGGGYQRSIRFEGGISGNGTVTLNSSGANLSSILIQGDTSGFTGTLIVPATNSGTSNVSIQSASGWGTGATLVVNASVTVNNGTTAMNTSRYTQASVGSDVNNATGALTLNTGGVFATAANITVGSFNGTGGTITLPSAKTLTVGALGLNDSFAGVIAGSGGAFVKQGSGTMTLTGSNSFTGGTTVSAGTLVTGNTSALGTGSVTVGGGTLRPGATGITAIASLAVDSGGLDTSAGTITTTGAFSLAGGTWTVGASANGVSAGSFSLTGGVIDLGLLSTTDKQNSGFSLIAGTGSTSLTNANFINGSAGFTYALDTNGDLVATAVPEPATYGLAGAGLLAAAAAVRRRRRRK